MILVLKQSHHGSTGFTPAMAESSGVLPGLSPVASKPAIAAFDAEAVDPRGTSQTCPAGRAIAAKRLSDRTHRCEWGCLLDRDVAAAKLILQRAVH